MKRFSQTIKIGLTLFVAVFSNGLLPSVAAAAVPPEEQTIESVSEVIAEPETVPAEPLSNYEETPDVPALNTLLFTPEAQNEGQVAAFGGPQFPQRDTLVVPEEPTVSDICGTGGDTYTIPNGVVGVEYYLREKNGYHTTDTLLTQGKTYSTHNKSSVTIVAKTKNDRYIFENNRHELEWQLRFKDKCTICHRTTSVANPYVSMIVDPNAIDGGHDTSDHYRSHTGPVFSATDTDGAWGDIIPPLPGKHGGLNWTSEGQTIYNNNCVVPVTIEVTPGQCAYFDTTSQVTIYLTGTAKDTSLVIKDSQNTVIKRWDIAIDVNGNVTFPSLPVTYNGLAAGSYTVEIVSNKGDTLVSTLASKAFVIEQCYYTAYPEEPKKLDLCYTDKDKLYIKNTTGVTYTVNNVTMSGWIRYTGTALVVNAEPADGYMFEDEATASWTFDEDDFSNEDCLTITKSSKVASDTNHNGVIDAGDEISWEITVTNTSENTCENFSVTVDDDNATLENEGYISSLGAGESVTLTATSTITTADLKACKAINIASFSAWRSLARGETKQLRSVMDDESSTPLATGSTPAAVYILTCPSAGSGSGTSTETTTTPVTTTATAESTTATATVTVLPATGPTDNGNPFMIIIAAVIAYGATYFLQRRREISETN